MVCLLLFATSESCIPPEGVDRIAAPYTEDTIRYHLESMFSRAASNILSSTEPGLLVDQDLGEIGLVDEYFVLNGQVQRLSKELNAGRAYDAGTMKILSDQLDWARGRRQLLKGQVESIITKQVGEALLAEGLEPPNIPQGANWSFPPSTFFLLKSPFVLVVSPRDRIEITSSYLLASQLSLSTIEGIESQVEGEGVSALVEGTGGFSLYPAWVSEDETLRQTLEIVAHEWTHAYLFLFFPLGRAYFQDYQMRTVNETVADIVGREIGERVYRQYYAALEPPAPQATAAAVGERDSDFGRQLRSIRVAVETMLTESRVEEAEVYMEVERKRLVDKGYYLRRLNQAYFALHGTYATTPGFESAIGTELKAIRAKSTTLGEFVRLVGNVANPGDLPHLSD